MTDSATFQSRDTLVASGITVRHFRQIVLWPLQLIPLRDDVQIHRHWDFLAQPGPSNPWHEVRDEFTGNPGTSRSATTPSSSISCLMCSACSTGREGRDRPRKPPPANRRSAFFGAAMCKACGSRSPATAFPSTPASPTSICTSSSILDVVIPVFEIFGEDLDLSRRTRRPVPLRKGVSPALGGRWPGWALPVARRVARSEAARCSPVPTTSAAPSIWSSPASIGRRRSPPTGNGCWRPMVQHHSAEVGPSALPTTRISPDADHGLSRAGRRGSADPRRLGTAGADRGPG